MGGDRKRTGATAAASAGKAPKADDLSSPNASSRRTGEGNDDSAATAAHLALAVSQDSVTDTQLAETCKAVEAAAARAAEGTT